MQYLGLQLNRLYRDSQFTIAPGTAKRDHITCLSVWSKNDHTSNQICMRLKMKYTCANCSIDSLGDLKRRSTRNIPYESGSAMCSAMNRPNPDKFVDTEGTPRIVHSAIKGRKTKSHSNIRLE